MLNIKNYLKISLILLLFVSFLSCREKKTADNASSVSDEKFLIDESEKKSLPVKEKADSTLMSESPVNPFNIDNFLFRDDCLYIDLRSPEAFYKEGHIAGFTNIPFYGYLAGFPGNKNPLFEMKKSEGKYLGDAGTFFENYEESAQIVSELFPKNKKIIAISTAGVESCYFLNLLIQLGYNGENLYNAGSFTNGMGKDIAYRSYKEARFLVKGIELSDTKIEYSFKGLDKK